jgi:DNA-binding transcriptional MocR family regulator
MSKPYARIADRIAEQIVSGELPVGTRLPPQRDFAHENGIATSTASRVYEELGRRGLVAGEVGRGTYVTNRFAPLTPPLQEPSGTDLDLVFVFRLSSSSREKISASTARFIRKGFDEQTVAIPSVTADSETLKLFADMSAPDSTTVSPDTVLLAGSGKEAIAASLAALARRGSRIAVEALTYPNVISAARLFGIELVPIPLTEEGMDLDALEHQASIGLDGVYIQPTLQSPMVLTMGELERKKVADILIRHDIVAIEDRVNSFLRQTTPIAAYAPNHVIQIDSLSKRLIPGPTLGIIIAPLHLHNSITSSIHSGGWMAPQMSVMLARHWIEDGVVAAVEKDKRHEAKVMYDIAKKSFAGLDFNGAEDALHAWINLPPNWRSERFASESAKLGISVAQGKDFAVTQGVAPSGVRVAFSAPNLTTWQFATNELSRLARQL